MLQIKKLKSDQNVILVIFTAETQDDLDTLMDLITCYASDHYGCIVSFDELKFPVQKEVTLTLDRRDESIKASYLK